MTVELKPCPLCEGDAAITQGFCGFYASCQACNLTLGKENDVVYPTGDFSSELQAAEAWNTRADVKPKVKPLKFTPRPKKILPDNAHLAADCHFGRYYICNRGKYGFGWKRAGSYVFQDFEETEIKAKDAAQADYERRILEALE